MGKWNDNISLRPRGSVRPTSVAALLRTLQLTNAPELEQRAAISTWLLNNAVTPLMEYSLRSKGYADLLEQSRGTFMENKNPGTTFHTELKLGDRYRDAATGFEGTATCITFYQHGCERVTLKGINKNGEIVDYGFDAPELEHIDPKTAQPTPVKVIEAKTGGPHDRAPMRRR